MRRHLVLVLGAILAIAMMAHASAASSGERKVLDFDTMAPVTGPFVGSIAVRADRFLYAGWYAGARAGWLIEEDAESYGGQGAFVGAQAGYLFGRSLTSGRVGIEAQGALPLFKPRADKAGSVVFPLGGLAVRFLL